MNNDHQQIPEENTSVQAHGIHPEAQREEQFVVQRTPSDPRSFKTTRSSPSRIVEGIWVLLGGAETGANDDAVCGRALAWADFRRPASCIRDAPCAATGQETARHVSILQITWPMLFDMRESQVEDATVFLRPSLIAYSNSKQPT